MFMKANISKAINQINELPQIIKEGLISFLNFVTTFFLHQLDCEPLNLFIKC